MFQDKLPLSTRTTRHTEKQINATRLTYTPAATRGSILYFVIADLGNITTRCTSSRSSPSFAIAAFVASRRVFFW